MTVGSNARINIISGATVIVGDTSVYDGSGENSEPNGALYDQVLGNSVNFTGTNGHLVFSRTANITYRGNISGGVDLTESGSGILVLSGSNSYTNGTYVSSGMLMAENSNALPDGGNLYIGSGVGAFGTLVPDDVPAAGVALAAVPEPGSLAMLFSGAAGFGAAFSRRRRGKTSSRVPEGLIGFPFGRPMS